ncbi:carboxypeptidase-like regulatory domain-containing protein [Emticicia sp. C21]|uniref:carboxypeptidase-like regulatory domain-containing protein n=1 Tax=Emticicia sp. C21 TaxID=2302915 RepID=UPI000E352D80|nr:carboxypeptidase-like regulatory domain-containing protein [Emticicia sp. C21]RFS14575.1 carboxypeptidase-like regulatory domain-containing protein [Emticicia sp. C21]
MKARYYLPYILFIFSFSGYSQKNFWTISGIVANEKKMAVQSANVFVNNTSIGFVTNEKGNFQLNVPDKFSQVELIVCFEGYKTIKRKINYSTEIQVFRFQLERDGILKKTVVTAKKEKDWKNKWEIFENALLGNSKFAKNCKILNSNVVRLEFDKDKKMTATATAPIQIINEALGYKILLLMDKFESDSSGTNMSALKFFEKVNTTNIDLKNKWDKNQKDAFSGSFHNFLMVLTDNKLEENDFEIFKKSSVQTAKNDPTTVEKELNEGTLTRAKANEIYIYNKDAESFLLQSDSPLLVFFKKSPELKPAFSDYPFKSSEIVLLKSYARFNENGWLRRPNDIVLKGFWGDKGLANQLPDDYNLDGLIKEPNDASTINKLSKRQ